MLGRVQVRKRRVGTDTSMFGIAAMADECEDEGTTVTECTEENC